MGKYGSRSISDLTMDFANNEGVVQDVADLASVVYDLYKKKWTSEFEVLTAEYDKVNQFKITSLQTSTHENALNETSNSSVESESTSSSESSNNTSETDVTEFGKKVDEAVSNEVVVSRTVDTDNTIQYEHEDTDTETTSGKVETAHAGTYIEHETTDNTPGKNVTTTEVTNNGDIDEQNHYGVERTVEGDSETTKIVQGVSDSTRKVVPFDVGSGLQDESGDGTNEGSGFRDVEKTVNDNTGNENSTEKNLTLERTTDFSTQNTSVTEAVDKTTTTSSSIEDPVKETQTYDDLQTTKHHSTKYSDGFGQFNWSKDVTENKVAEAGTTTTSVTDGTEESGTESNTKTITGGETVEGTKSETVTNQGSSNKSEAGTETSNVSKTGNLGVKPIAESLLKELELRRENIYDMMLKDVASILTLSVYA